MRKELREFKLHTPVIDNLKGTMLLSSTLPVYGIFYFNDEGHLKKVYTYDLDGRKIKVPFSNIFGSTNVLPFNTDEEISQELRRLAEEEVNLPKLAVSDQGGMVDIFSRQAALLSKLKTLLQLKIVREKFYNEED